MFLKINNLLTSGAMQNPLRSIGILVGVASTVIGGAVAAQPATFMIVNSGSGLCLERNGSGLGEPILQQPCDSRRTTQHWVKQPCHRHDFMIASPISVANLCLDVRDGVDADRTVLQQWACDLHAPSMRWQFPPSFRTVSSNSFLRLGHGAWTSPGSPEPGAQIQIFRRTQANTNTAQIWETRAILQ